MVYSSITAVYINSSTDSDCLMFKIAIYHAEEGFNVWFIAPEPIQKFPQNLTIPNKEILKSITFFYLQTVDDLVKKLNSIQVWERTAEVLIITGYEHYIMNDIQNQDADRYPSDVLFAAYVTASVHDAALACSRKINSNVNGHRRQVRVFVSCNSDNKLKPKRTMVQSLIHLFFEIVLDTRNKTCECCFQELLSLLK